MFAKIKLNYQTVIQNKNFLRALLSSVTMLLTALLINFFAGIYALERASNTVTDLILNNIRVFDVDMVFIYGPLLMFVVLILILLVEPRRIPFVLNAISLFVVIRSGFVALTHLGPPPNHAVIVSDFMGYFTTGSDLFFSGHTGLPFLLALIFWEKKIWRYLFGFLSLVFGMVVLMGHLHYSIDVLSAFFITYAIYHLATTIFPRAKNLFDFKPLNLLE